jgi:Ca2+-binding EF-hand superfamily protein
LFNLDRHSLNDVLDTLVEAGPDGHLTLEQFSHALLLLMRLGGNLDARSSSGATSREYSEALNLVEAIFEEFDVAGQGRVDLSQLTSGLSILFPVPMAAKVNFAFALYDADGDGLVSFSELVEYLASVFAVLFVSAPELRPSSSLNAEELAEATATQAFGEVGLTPQHKLPKHLFKAFVERGLGFS